MDNSVLKASGDPMGAAIYDYYITAKAEMPEQYKTIMLKYAQRLMETR